MQIDLSGRTALVTGGSEGIGKAIARRFAASGANVVCLARNEERLRRAVEEISQETSSRIEGIACDVTSADQTGHAVLRSSELFGRVDILVNNAGSSFRKPVMELTREDMIADLDLKLFAAIRLVQLVVPKMKEQRWGRILNILSVNSKTPAAESMPTTLSRSAGLTMTKVMSREFAAWNILVNALGVGRIKSGQWERRRLKNAPEMSLEEFVKPQTADIPLGRLGEAEEFANVACFFASDAASYVTGTMVNVDGGMCPVL